MRLTCHDGHTRAHTHSEVGQDQPLRAVLDPDALGLVLPLCVVLVQGLESETLSGERGVRPSSLEIIEQHLARLTLHPLEVHHVGDLLLRRVVLLADERPVEYGAIRIHLNAFTPEAREKIEAGQTPLGAILRTTDMPYRCQPRGYFRVEADPVTRQGLSLGSQGDIVLYGRLAHLTGPEGRTLAQVVEILPPAEPRT